MKKLMHIFIVAATVFGASVGVMSQSVSQVILGETLGNERRGSWFSYGLKLGDGFYYRASATDTNRSSTIALDIQAGSCLSLLSVIFPYSTPLERDITATSVLIDARVDAGPVFYATGTYSGTMGDKFGIIYLDYTDEYEQILRMMRAGNIIRMKFQHKSGEYIDTVSYPLSGFTYSSNRIQSICTDIKNSYRSTPEPKVKPAPYLGDRLKNL